MMEEEAVIPKRKHQSFQQMTKKDPLSFSDKAPSGHRNYDSYPSKGKQRGRSMTL